MLFETNKDKGRAGLAMAIAYFGSNGYVVNIPLNDTQWYDFIIEKNGIFETVQCKATGTENNAISLRSFGGSKGTEYDNVINHSELTWLFCLDKNANMFLIPVKDLLREGNRNQITLRTEPSANKQGFQTYKYVVHI